MTFSPNQTHIVGILNLTPDSFSDGGQFIDPDTALARARQMVADGADIIEIGGESTRPGYTPVPVAQELERVLPVAKALVASLSVPIAIDTQKPSVADAVLGAGISILNDISCLADTTLATVAAKHGAYYVLMHNRPHEAHPAYQQLIPDILADLQAGIDTLRAAGVPTDKIIIDPGIGFAKHQDENIEILRQLHQFTQLPCGNGETYPLLVGASKKRFMEHALGLGLTERSEATIAVTAYAIQQGTRFIRVHDVLANKRAARMIDHLLAKGANEHDHPAH